ncbi:MAG: methionine--tRNA ligase, partial [Spirochaetia bacterium]
AKLRGVESHGMLLAAGDDKTVKVLEAPNSALGSGVLVEGHEIGTKRITIDDFAKVPLTVKDKKVLFGDIVLKTETEDISVDAPDGFKIS